MGENKKVWNHHLVIDGGDPKYFASPTPRKINMKHNHGGLVQIIFLSFHGWIGTLQGTNISHLGKFGISSLKCHFGGDMLCSSLEGRFQPFIFQGWSDDPPRWSPPTMPRMDKISQPHRAGKSLRVLWPSSRTLGVQASSTSPQAYDMNIYEICVPWGSPPPWKSWVFPQFRKKIVNP